MSKYCEVPNGRVRITGVRKGMASRPTLTPFFKMKIFNKNKKNYDRKRYKGIKEEDE